MSGNQKYFEEFLQIWPKGAFAKPVMGERGQKNLPSGTEGGENLDLPRKTVNNRRQRAYDKNGNVCFTVDEDIRRRLETKLTTDTFLSVPSHTAGAPRNLLQVRRTGPLLNRRAIYTRPKNKRGSLRAMTHGQG